MAGRRLDTMDLRELLRHIQQTPSDRAVQRATGIDRRTVQHYRKWTTEHSLLEGSLPPIETLQQLVGRTLSQPPPPQNVSTVEPYRDIVTELRQSGTEVTAIWHRLKERGYAGGLSSVYRFVAQLEKDKISNGATVRVERAPGEGLWRISNKCKI